MKGDWSEWLQYRETKASNATIERYFKKYREEKGILLRCDMEDCQFYQSTPVWKGKPIRLILDHKDGCNSNNRSENLRFVCPNCNSQLTTHGGGNKGRVLRRNKSSFAINAKEEGRVKEFIIPGTTGLRAKGQPSKKRVRQR